MCTPDASGRGDGQSMPSSTSPVLHPCCSRLVPRFPRGQAFATAHCMAVLRPLPLARRPNSRPRAQQRSLAPPTRGAATDIWAPQTWACLGTGGSVRPDQRRPSMSPSAPSPQAVSPCVGDGLSAGHRAARALRTGLEFCAIPAGVFYRQLFIAFFADGTPTGQVRRECTTL